MQFYSTSVIFTHYLTMALAIVLLWLQQEETELKMVQIRLEIMLRTIVISCARHRGAAALSRRIRLAAAARQRPRDLLRDRRQILRLRLAQERGMLLDLLRQHLRRTPNQQHRCSHRRIPPRGGGGKLCRRQRLSPRLLLNPDCQDPLWLLFLWHLRVNQLLHGLLHVYSTAFKSPKFILMAQ